VKKADTKPHKEAENQDGEWQALAKQAFMRNLLKTSIDNKTVQRVRRYAVTKFFMHSGAPIGAYILIKIKIGLRYRTG
jgi:hypothetical protein